jgi:hypothetical protein
MKEIISEYGEYIVVFLIGSCVIGGIYAIIAALTIEEELFVHSVC